MLIVYILLSLLFFFMSMWIAYVAGMSKGFQNLMNDDPNFKFGSLDAAVYSNLSGKKLKDIGNVSRSKGSRFQRSSEDRKKKCSSKEIFKEKEKIK